jgi:hypothetical protein
VLKVGEGGRGVNVHALGRVHAQFDRVLDTLADKLPAVVDHLETARADVLANTRVPEGDPATALVQQSRRYRAAVPIDTWLTAVLDPADPSILERIMADFLAEAANPYAGWAATTPSSTGPTVTISTAGATTASRRPRVGTGTRPETPADPGSSPVRTHVH